MRQRIALEWRAGRPTGNPDRPTWAGFGEKQDFIVGEPVNYIHTYRIFHPPIPPVFPAVYGRIGTRVWVMMVSRPEVGFFLNNTGGHFPFYPVQNPAWDFELKLPDYEQDRPFGFRGRLIYKAWTGTEEIVSRYKQWRQELDQGKAG